MKRNGLFYVELALIVTAWLCPLAKAVGSAEEKTQGLAVAYTKIGMGDYQNFLTNWDEKQQPVRYALIQTPSQYGALFHPAALMGDKRPFAPPAGLYDNEQILVVARVIPAPEKADKVFEVESLVARGAALELKYRFKEPSTNATYSVKNCLILRLPKQAYEKVSLIENGKPTGELKPAEGIWSVPAASPKPE